MERGCESNTKRQPNGYRFSVFPSPRGRERGEGNSPQVSVFQYVLPLPAGEGGVRASAHTVQKMQNGNPQVTVFSVFPSPPWERAG